MRANTIAGQLRNGLKRRSRTVKNCIIACAQNIWLNSKLHMLCLVCIECAAHGELFVNRHRRAKIVENDLQNGIKSSAHNVCNMHCVSTVRKLRKRYECIFIVTYCKCVSGRCVDALFEPNMTSQMARETQRPYNIHNRKWSDARCAGDTYTEDMRHTILHLENVCVDWRPI